MSQRSVILGGQVLHGRDRLGSWQVSTIDGWSKTPPTKGESVDRPGADGEYDLPVQYGARALVVSGRVVCRSQRDADAARYRVLGLLNSKARLQVTGPSGPTLWADVRRNGQIVADVVGPLVRFTIEAKAVDPLKYGETHPFTLSSAYAELSHRGNYLASPVVTVTGNAPGGYTIQEPGGVQYQVTGPISPGQTHTIDFRTGIFRINGLIISGQTGVTDIWYIEPGYSKGMRVTSSGSVTATATVTDTFI